jgi:hypothetical protein
MQGKYVYTQGNTKPEVFTDIRILLNLALI